METVLQLRDLHPQEVTLEIEKIRRRKSFIIVLTWSGFKGGSKQLRNEGVEKVDLYNVN